MRIYLAVFLVLYFFGLDSLQAQVRCENIYSQRWANQQITQPIANYRTEVDIEALSHQQILRRLEQPFEIKEESNGTTHSIKPVVIHPLQAFEPYYRGIIEQLFARSVRESWLGHATDIQLQRLFERVAERNNKSLQEVREFYESDITLFAELIRMERLQAERLGVEVAQFVVEFRDGSKVSSRPFSDYLTHEIKDMSGVLDPFLANLPNKPIKALHIFHTHPSEFPGSAGALSFVDLTVLGQVRTDLMLALPRQNVETIDFHIFAIARSERQLLIGHYSERGFGFE